MQALALPAAGRLMALVSLTVLPPVLAAGCGEGRGTRPAAIHQAARPGSYVKLDADKDNDDLPHPVKAEDDDQALVRAYGAKAPPAEARAIAALVKSYYAASSAGEAARACSLLEASLAAGLSARGGPAAGGGRGACAGPMSLLLARQHRRLLAEDAATMTVVEVRARGPLGLAVLGFRGTPESDIVVAREGRTWKLAALFASYMS